MLSSLAVRLSALACIGLPLAHAANAAPQVNVGVDRTITQTTVNTAMAFTINASVTDDGLPAGGQRRYQWTVIEAWDFEGFPMSLTAAAAIFQNAQVEDARVTFNVEPGRYRLQLTVSDGQLTGRDDLTVIVNRAPGVPAVRSLSLINADTGQPVPGYESLGRDNIYLDRSNLPPRLSIRANTVTPTVGSVFFQATESYLRIENTAPYALAGDRNGLYTPYAFQERNEVIAIPYSGSNIGGNPGYQRRTTVYFFGTTPSGNG